MRPDYNFCYAFSLGYYDGRNLGWEKQNMFNEKKLQYAYNKGYERGMKDFCLFDQ
jgi:hypothetical protein